MKKKIEEHLLEENLVFIQRNKKISGVTQSTVMNYHKTDATFPIYNPRTDFKFIVYNYFKKAFQTKKISSSTFFLLHAKLQIDIVQNLTSSVIFFARTLRNMKKLIKLDVFLACWKEPNMQFYREFSTAISSLVSLEDLKIISSSHLHNENYHFEFWKKQIIKLQNLYSIELDAPTAVKGYERLIILKKLKFIQKFNFKRTHFLIGSDDVHASIYILNLLSRLKNLKRLRFELNSRISDSGADLFSKMLYKITTVTSFNLNLMNCFSNDR